MVKKWQERANGVGFAVLLSIVVLAPLPFGANRPLFWFLLSVLLGFLVLYWAVTALVSYRDFTAIVTVPFARFRVEAGLMLILVLWFPVQAASWVPQSWLHPVWSASAPYLSGATEAISATPEATLDAWVRFLGYGAVFFLAMQYGRDPGRARLALWGVALSGIAYSLYGVVIQLGNYDTILWYHRWAYHDSLTSTFVNRNSFAAFAGVSLIACFALLVRIERQAEMVVEREGPGAYLDYLAARGLPLALGATVILTAILLSHSRAGLVVTALGFTALYLCRRLRDWGRNGEVGRERTGWLRLAPLAMALVLLAAVAISGAVTLKRADQAAENDAGGRAKFYSTTLTAIADRIWLGHGLGSYRWVFEGYRTPELLRFGTIDKAHNSYLEFAFEAGVPAFLVLMVLYGRLFVRCLKGVRQRQIGSHHPAVAVSVAVLLATHSLVDFSLQIPAITVVFLFLFGVGLAQSWSSQTD